MPRQPKAKIPPDLRWAVWERDNFTCVYCGARKPLSCDRKIPESQGGPTTLENLVTACWACNSEKHCGDHEAFRRWKRINLAWRSQTKSQGFFCFDDDDTLDAEERRVMQWMFESEKHRYIGVVKLHDMHKFNVIAWRDFRCMNAADFVEVINALISSQRDQDAARVLLRACKRYPRNFSIQRIPDDMEKVFGLFCELFHGPGESPS